MILRPFTVIDPGDPGRYVAVVVAAALDRHGRIEKGATSVARCAETELTRPLRLAGKGSGNSAATLGQLCVISEGVVLVKDGV
ncbi:MAG: hypothetical protein U9N56_03625 [Actinomycetota bacterium]|nr:hypothetical protein [Actinomycetota bacterium]